MIWVHGVSGSNPESQTAAVASVVERLAVDEFVHLDSIPIGRHAGIAQRQSKRLVALGRPFDPDFRL